MIIKESIEVERRYFQQAELTMDYWPDRSDETAVAKIELSEDD